MTDEAPQIGTTLAAVIDLDKKLTSAYVRRGGMILTYEHLEVLAQVGLVQLVAELKANILKDMALCRQSKVVSISGGSSGSTSPGAPVASPSANDGTSGGTSPEQDTSAARARARQMFE